MKIAFRFITLIVFCIWWVTPAASQETLFIDKIKASGFQGTAVEGGQKWPFKATDIIVSEGGKFEGRLEWETLGAIHKIKGIAVGSILAFKEIEFIKKGNAILGCEYTLDTRISTNGLIKGTYKCDGAPNSGTVAVNIPVSSKADGGAQAQVPAQSIQPSDKEISQYRFYKDNISFLKSCNRQMQRWVPRFIENVENEIESYRIRYNIPENTEYRRSELERQDQVYLCYRVSDMFGKALDRNMERPK